MRVRLRLTQDNVEPVADEDGADLWEGGYGDGFDADPRSLPASSLSECLPELEIGTWHRVDDVAKALDRAEAPRPDVWTAVEIPVPAMQGGEPVPMQVNMAGAAVMMLRGVVELARQLERPGNVWVRLE